MLLIKLEKCPFCKKLMMSSGTNAKHCVNKACGSEMFQKFISPKKDVIYKFCMQSKMVIVKIYYNILDSDQNYTKIFSNDPSSNFFYGRYKQEGQPLIYLVGDDSLIPNFKKLKELEDKINMLVTFA